MASQVESHTVPTFSAWIASPISPEILANLMYIRVGFCTCSQLLRRLFLPSRRSPSRRHSLRTEQRKRAASCTTQGDVWINPTTCVGSSPGQEAAWKTSPRLSQPPDTLQLGTVRFSCTPLVGPIASLRFFDPINGGTTGAEAPAGTTRRFPATRIAAPTPIKGAPPSPGENPGFLFQGGGGRSFPSTPGQSDKYRPPLQHSVAVPKRSPAASTAQPWWNCGKIPPMTRDHARSPTIESHRRHGRGQAPMKTAQTRGSLSPWRG